MFDGRERDRGAPSVPQKPGMRSWAITFVAAKPLSNPSARGAANRVDSYPPTTSHEARGKNLSARGGVNGSPSNVRRGHAVPADGSGRAGPDAPRRDSGLHSARWKGQRPARRGARDPGDQERPDRFG